jgi:transposase-like protein
MQDVSAENAQAPAATVIKTRRTRRPRLSPDEKREVARLYADTSTSTSEICARLGIAESSLYRIVQRQGLPPRGRTVSSTSSDTTQRPLVRKTGRNGSSNAGDHRVVRPDSTAVASGDGVADQAIESETKQAPPKPAAQRGVVRIARGAKSVTGRRRIATVAGRPRVEAPIETPAASSTPLPTATRRSRTASVASSTELRQFVVTFLAQQTLQAASVLGALQQAQERGALEVTSIVRLP